MSFDDLESFACGEIGLDIDYFYRLTPRQFTNIVEGHHRKIDEETKRQYEQTRLIMYAALVPWKKLKLEDVLRFPWDEKQPEKKYEPAKNRRYKTKAELEKLFKDK